MLILQAQPVQSTRRLTSIPALLSRDGRPLIEGDRRISRAEEAVGVTDVAEEYALAGQIIGFLREAHPANPVRNRVAEALRSARREGRHSLPVRLDRAVRPYPGGLRHGLQGDEGEACNQEAGA